MSKKLTGESPGWHAVDASGAPVSGPWVTKTDAIRQAAAKAAAAVVNWNGTAVVVA